jgi:hypothetical protein
MYRVFFILYLSYNELMRFILLLTLVLSGMTCIAQSRFSRQIREVINDTNNNFKTFQGAYNKERYTFDPKTSIEGTINGKIYSVSDNSYYYMEVSGSDTGDSAIADSILNFWVTKLTPVLGKEFTLSKDKSPAGFKACFVKGYLFRHDHLFLSVYQWKRFSGSKTIHFVRLMFTLKPNG